MLSIQRLFLFDKILYIIMYNIIKSELYIEYNPINNIGKKIFLFFFF